VFYLSEILQERTIKEVLLETTNVIMRTVIMTASGFEAEKLRAEVETISAVTLLGSVANEDELRALSQLCAPDVLLFVSGNMGSEEVQEMLESLPDLVRKVIVISPHPASLYKQNERINTSAIYWLKTPYGKGELSVILTAIVKEHRSLAPHQIQESPNRPYTACMEWESAQIKRLALQTLSEIHFVCIRDIMYCKASGSYTEFFLQNGSRIMTSTSIKRYEEMLVPFGFYRAHKSFLINNLHVVRVIKTGYGFAQMSDGAQIEISRRKKEGFLSTILDHVLTKD